MKTLKYLTILIALFTTPVYSQIINIVNPNPTDSLDYHDIVVTDISEDAVLVHIAGRDFDFTLTAMSFNHVNSVVYGMYQKPLDEFNFKKLVTFKNANNSPNNNSMLLEIRDTSELEAFGFMYLTPHNSINSPTQGMVDTIMGIWKPIGDSILTANDLPTSNFSIDTNTVSLGGAKAYIISFDQPDPYEVGYTFAERSYQTIYDSSTNDDKFELILDNDRNCELVGFRYYSDLNDQEYTIFIKPDN